MFKLNRLLFSSSESDVFINRILPTAEQRETLKNAKNEIRDFLRPRIREATVKILGMEKAISPRFRTQGSWSYATCIQPAWNPPQQMDWDFGVYLPVTVWEDGGPPQHMARLYFTLVEELLRDFCTVKGWKLISGKLTCIRIQIDVWAHIDLPLYAAPEVQFAQIVEKVATAALNKSLTRDGLSESIEMGEMPEQEWKDLDCIVMATRSGEWKISDPEAVAKWFDDRCLEHTDQLRRACRYLKAWRDLHWKAGDGPTSVCIMIIVAQTFRHLWGRDDLVLEASARALAQGLKGEVRERGIDQGVEDFNSRLTAVEGAAAAAAAQAELLANHLRDARMLQGHRAGDAIGLLVKQLGDRIPNRPDLVEVDGAGGGGAEADAVRATAAQQVARPIVKATNAG